MSDKLLKTLHREAELQRRFMRYSQALGSVEAVDFINEAENALKNKNFVVAYECMELAKEHLS